MDAGGRSEKPDDEVCERDAEGGGLAAARLTPRFSASTASRYDVSAQADDELAA